MNFLTINGVQISTINSSEIELIKPIINKSFSEQNEHLKTKFSESRLKELTAMDILDWHFPISEYTEVDDPSTFQGQLYKLSDAFVENPDKFIAEANAKYGMSH